MNRLAGLACAVCGSPLPAGRHPADLWGNVFCARHLSEYPQCTACNRVVSPRLTGGGVTYADGRVVCNVCRRTAVDTKLQAKPLVEGVAGWLDQRGLRFTGLVLKVELESGPALAGMNGDRSSPTGAGAGRVLGALKKVDIFRGSRVTRKVDGMSILSGLPRELFEGVTAHELGHAWLYLAHVDGLQPWEEEGFCNLLSYILHKDRPTEEARFWVQVLEQDPDPVYGEGFRRVRAIFKKHGFTEAMRLTFNNKRMPAG